MATVLACSAVSEALGRVLVQPTSSNVTMMIDAIFIKRAKPPNEPSSGTAAERDVEWNNDKQIS